MHSAACTFNPKVTINKSWASLEDTLKEDRSPCEKNSDSSVATPQLLQQKVQLQAPCRKGRAEVSIFPPCVNAFLPLVSPAGDMPKAGGCMQEWEWDTPWWAAAQKCNALSFIRATRMLESHKAASSLKVPKVMVQQKRVGITEDRPKCWQAGGKAAPLAFLIN